MLNRLSATGFGLTRWDQWVILFLAVGVFYRPEVTNAWLALAMTVSVVRIGITLYRRPRGIRVLPAIALIAAINLAVFASTLLQAPDFMEEYLRHVLIPSLLAIAIPLAFDNGVAVRRLGEAIAFGSVVLIALNLAQYWQEYLELGGITDDIRAHRRYGDGLIVVIPAVLMVVFTTRSRGIRAVAVVAAVVGVAMLALTGMRGGWLAFGLSMLTVLWVARGQIAGSSLAAMAAILAVTVAVTSVLAPSKLTVKRLEQGLSTTHRADGTWRPAMDMIQERPLAGFGFGERVFHASFNARRATHPDWGLKRSKGPHSSYLGLAFAAGLPTMIAYIALLWGTLGIALRRAAQRLADPDAHDHALLGLALIAALLAAYGIHGIFETKTWAPFGILLGGLLAWLQTTPPMPRAASQRAAA